MVHSLPLDPPPRLGERLSLRVLDEAGRATDLVGFVVALDPLTLETRDGSVRPAARVSAARRVGVALGRDPQRTPRDLLDDLADRAGLTGGLVRVDRLSDLLAGLVAPPSVPSERGTWTDGTVRARVEGEWLTTDAEEPATLVRLAWWATRQGARSVQVRARG